ncbi:hypothetical protein [Cohnella mopanensis]|uniref:hypothetical protein n=1 Tax=Cohnella mopanensis TaxID=2911966 RepID=UPI001EF9862A|nr:hypothetical protein [Cohnella mopanensis]
MFKWVSWVVRMGATALLLSFLCIWTTGYIVNSYMETVVKQLDLPIEIQPIALSGVWGTLWGADKQPKKEVQEEASQSPSGNNVDEPRHTQASGELGGESSSDESSGDGNPVTDPVTNKGQEIQPNGEASPSPGPAPEGNLEEDGTVPVFNGEAAIGQLTDSERQKLYAMVVSKLSQEQLKQLSDSLQGGLTSEELASVKGMLKAALTDEEYAQMMEVLEGTKKSEQDVIPD